MMTVFVLAFVTMLLISCNCLKNPPHRESNNQGKESMDNTQDRMSSIISIVYLNIRTIELTPFSSSGS